MPGAAGKQGMNAASQERCSADVHKKVSTRPLGDLSKPPGQREHLERPLRFSVTLQQAW